MEEHENHRARESDAHFSAIDPADAADMWCPEVRRLYADEDGSGAGINRRTDVPYTQVAACIGPKCMAWRFVSGREDVGYCGKAGGA
jgi:hypothetical protein